MRDKTDSRTLPLPLPRRAMTNAERQAAWRARRNAQKVAGVTRYAPVLGQVDASVTPELTAEAVQHDWVTRLAAGKLNPYQQHCFRIRYGCDLFFAVRGGRVA